MALWWQIQLDPCNTRARRRVRAQVDAAIAAADAWTLREPQRAEAWFYLGGAYGARVQWRVLRGERLAAARDGKRIKESLERALALDPAMADAYFGIGLYHYYADVAPAALQDAAVAAAAAGRRSRGGLEEMLRARDRRSAARAAKPTTSCTSSTSGTRSSRSARSSCSTDLRERHPRNPHFPQAAAEIQDFYIDDTAASLRSWQALLDAASGGPRRRGRDGRGERAPGHRLAARSALARAKRRSNTFARSSRATPRAPFGAVARAHLQLGDALEHLGRRSEATAAYRRRDRAPPARDDPLRIATRARALRCARNVKFSHAIDPTLYQSDGR